MNDPAQLLTVDERALASVRHDLRTPLVNLTLVAKLLGQEGERDGDLGGLVGEAAHRLGRMTRDLLDFTLVRLGHPLLIQRRPLDLYALIERALLDLAPSLPQHALELQPGAAIHGSFDPERSVQLVECLVEHAVRCGSSRAAVRLSARVRGDQVELCAHVDGPGISAQRRAGWFLDAEDSAAIDRDVGIGPYLARAIAQAHGGSVEVTSSDADGTAFTARFSRVDSSEASPARDRE